MDLLKVRNILGQINLAANEGAGEARDPKIACATILKLTDEMAKAMDFPSATVTQAEQPVEGNG